MSAHRSTARVSTPLDRVAGSATPALILPVALAVGMLVIAGVSGKLGYLVEHLPLTEKPNGFAVFCLIVLAAVCCWRQIRRMDRQDFEDELLCSDCHLDEPELYPSDPWLGTEPDKWPVGS